MARVNQEHFFFVIFHFVTTREQLIIHFDAIVLQFKITQWNFKNFLFFFVNSINLPHTVNVYETFCQIESTKINLKKKRKKKK